MHFAVAMLRLVDRAAGAGTGGERIYSIEREVRTFEVRWRGARQAPAVGRSGAAEEIRWVEGTLSTRGRRMWPNLRAVLNSDMIALSPPFHLVQS